MASYYKVFMSHIQYTTVIPPSPHKINNKLITNHHYDHQSNRYYDPQFNTMKLSIEDQVHHLKYLREQDSKALP